MESWITTLASVFTTATAISVPVAQATDALLTADDVKMLAGSVIFNGQKP